MWRGTYATGGCAQIHGGLVLQGDPLAAGHSVFAPSVVPQLLQHARSWEELGTGSFPKVGQFVPLQSICTGACTAAKSSSTKLCHFNFCYCKRMLLHIWMQPLSLPVYSFSPQYILNCLVKDRPLYINHAFNFFSLQ